MEAAGSVDPKLRHIPPAYLRAAICFVLLAFFAYDGVQQYRVFGDAYATLIVMGTVMLFIPALPRRFAHLRPVYFALGAIWCVALFFLGDYLSGLGGHVLVWYPFLPAGAYPALGALWCGLASAAIALWQKRFSTLVLVTVIMAAACVGGVPLMPRNRLFLLGFRRHVFSEVTPDQLRQIAVKAASELKGDDSFMRIFHDGFAQMPEDNAKHQALLQELEAMPGFTKLHGAFWLSSRDGVVSLEWGGALTGHYGIVIRSPSVDETDERDGCTGFLKVEPDIALFTTAD